MYCLVVAIPHMLSKVCEETSEKRSPDEASVSGGGHHHSCSLTQLSELLSGFQHSLH